MQQWKVKRPSTDNSNHIPIVIEINGTPVRVHFGLEDALVSGTAQVTWKAGCRSCGGSSEGWPCHQAVLDTVAVSLCVLARGAGTGLGSRRGQREWISASLFISQSGHCLMQLCGGTVSAPIRPTGRGPHTYRAHVETEHHQLNHCWEKTIIVLK